MDFYYEALRLITFSKKESNFSKRFYKLKFFQKCKIFLQGGLI